MKRSILISLTLHLAAIAGVVWGTEGGSRAVGMPRKVYTVNLVGMPGGRGWLGAPGPRGGASRPSAPTPRTDVVRSRSRTGLKVEKAPSTDPFSPKGTKKPARTPGQKPGEEGSQAIGRKATPGGGGGGMRLEGEPFPYPDYLDDLRRRIEQRWEVPLVAQQEALKATVFFRILRDGTIVDARVETSSGLLPFDRAALQAVWDASPLAPLPDKFPSDQLGVHLDFEY